MTSRDSRYIEWVQRKLDGELSPQEAKELEKVLASNPEMRRLEADLQELETRLRSLPLVSPTTDFKTGILQSIRSGGSKELDRSLQPAQPSASPQRRWWPYLYATAAGILIGFILFPVLIGPTGVPWSNSEPFQGSIVRPDGGGFALENQTLKAGGTEALAELRRSEDGVVFSIHAVADATGEVRLGFVPDELEYQGLRHFGSQPIQVSAGQDSLDILELSGIVHFYFRHRGSRESRLLVTLLANGDRAQTRFLVPSFWKGKE